MTIIATNRTQAIVSKDGLPITRFADVIDDLVDTVNDLTAKPVRNISVDTTLVLEDAGTVIRNTAGNITVTIPTGYDIGTEIEFQNDGTGTMKITVTDTLINSADGTTGIRTIAIDGEARTILVTSTQWKIRGEQLT